MIWPFDRDYMQLALAAGLVVGAVAPLIGAYLVQRRMALMGDSIGHAAFAGVAVGLFTGVWPLWTALTASVAAALGMEALRRRRRASGDLALAIVLYTGIAAGVVVIGLAGSLNAGLLSYLFGSILTVTFTEVVLVAGLGVAAAATVALTGRALFALALDEEWSRVAGLPVGALGATLSALAAVTIVSAMRVVGLLLVAALMVLPVAAAQQVCRSFRATLHTASFMGALSVVLGLAAARAWGLAPGGTIVLTAAIVFALAALTRTARRR